MAIKGIIAFLHSKMKVGGICRHLVSSLQSKLPQKCEVFLFFWDLFSLRASLPNADVLTIAWKA